MAKKKTLLLISDEMIITKICYIRGQKVMIDRDLADLYGVSTKRLNEQVKRNIKRFPKDFMFQLTEQERSEVVAKCDHLKMLKFSSSLPYAFSEHGAVMLASVLNSDRAISVNIQIVRVFGQIRQMLINNTELRLAIEKLNRNTDNNTKNIELLFQYLDELLDKKENFKKRKTIGYKIPKTK